MILIDTSEIYRKAFGIEPLSTIVYPQLWKEARKSEISYSGIERKDTDTDTEETTTSYLGTPVLMPIVLKGGTYNRLRKGKIETVSVDDLQLPDSTLCDFQRQKNIVTTPINGGSGTVIEMYSFENWQIKIYGLIYPAKSDIETQLKRLLNFENITDAIDVKSQMFQRLGIYQLIIKSIELPQLKGQAGVKPFLLNCESTEPVELIINN